MALVAAILLAVFVLPRPWGLLAVGLGALVEVGESLFWVRWSRRRRAQVGAETLVDAEGVVRDGGFVLVHGELWRAHSVAPLQPGTPVRIVRIDGLVLDVEPL